MRSRGARQDDDPPLRSLPHKSPGREPGDCGNKRHPANHADQSQPRVCMPKPGEPARHSPPACAGGFYAAQAGANRLAILPSALSRIKAPGASPGTAGTNATPPTHPSLRDPSRSGSRCGWYRSRPLPSPASPRCSERSIGRYTGMSRPAAPAWAGRAPADRSSKPGPEGSRRLPAGPPARTCRDDTSRCTTPRRCLTCRAGRSRWVGNCPPARSR